MVQLGDLVPDFEADTTQGKLQFHAWLADSWGILFSHPKDFTPVCTTELGEVARLLPEFERRSTKVIGLSVDDVGSHLRWESDIAEIRGYSVNFPMIGDADRRVANLYGMIHSNASDTLTVRSVFVIDPAKRLRLEMTYPASVGRNFVEILRVLDALQLTDEFPVATPVNWQQGEEVIVVNSVSDDEASRRFDGFRETKPYLRFVKDPKT
ncbi:peroxiredoxin [Ferrimicrobium acidiphilum]|jgi:alkyl hydroperoxide reductase subunit AhpC|uniref:Alkyl hydroperoxide reductase subunit C n=1 Tax=Ferrimicrobium acidiphilum DSM 19497 TaxID=1121877 RepID=A0A0D8FU90_9ACTN|nr:peroxiredoxin [Ferrimicrobium acidiphilum]KJE76835.1 alkyl hydroperoxide reductase subunit C [Ferrimicrobium acidiphilum DSM 19497]MCL5052474.1 peroxiredoxin [Gammaproteobacteria bacterium]